MIESYHAHVYFYDYQKDIASSLKERLAKLGGPNIGEISVGKMHTKPIGPHTKSQFQIGATPSTIHYVLEFLIENRSGLSVLIHPNSDDELKDHTEHAMWLGDKMSLNLDNL